MASESYDSEEALEKVDPKSLFPSLNGDWGIIKL